LTLLGSTSPSIGIPGLTELAPVGRLGLAGILGPLVTAASVAAGEAGVASCRAPLAGAGLMSAVGVGAFTWPKFGWFALHAATTWGSTCGNGRVAAEGCFTTCMIGTTQSSCSPVPVLAPPSVNPASLQDAMICSHGPCCAVKGTANPRTSPQRAGTDIGTGRIVIASDLMEASAQN